MSRWLPTYLGLAIPLRTSHREMNRRDFYFFSKLIVVPPFWKPSSHIGTLGHWDALSCAVKSDFETFVKRRKRRQATWSNWISLSRCCNSCSLRWRPRAAAGLGGVEGWKYVCRDGDGGGRVVNVDVDAPPALLWLWLLWYTVGEYILPPHSLTHSSIFQHNTPTLPPHPLYLHHIPQSIPSLSHPELNPKTPPNPHTYTKASKGSPRIKHRTSQIGATFQTSEQQQR